jgi:integrase
MFWQGDFVCLGFGYHPTRILLTHHLDNLLHGMTSNLVIRSVTPQTRKRYASGLRGFLSWMCTNSKPDPDSYEELDILLAEYIDWSYDEDDSRGHRQDCVNARCAIILILCNARLQLNISKKALLGWATLQPSVQRAPVTRQLFLCMVEFFLKKRAIESAIISTLCFEGYLRLSEALNLKMENVSLPSLNQSGAIRLPKAKTGLNQSITFSDTSLLGQMLRLYVQVGVNDQPMFKLSSAQFRRSLSQACVALGVDSSSFTPHSFRHGGATADFISGRPLNEIVLKGRWVVIQSAKRYIQAGRSLSIALNLPNSITQHGDNLHNNPQPLLARLHELLKK